ncbi:MAG: family 1 glycosylhydrolase [Lachnospiraceae bacterium]
MLCKAAECGNTASDDWVMEQLPHSAFLEPSGEAVDHYHRCRDDMKLLRDAGANAHRFSIEWARIEPRKNEFDDRELRHDAQMIVDCRAIGLEPVVILMHFTSPAWLIREGGWENPAVVGYFADYVRHVAPILVGNVRIVCTINEANIRLQLLELIKSYGRSQVQVGLNMNQNAAPSEGESAGSGKSVIVQKLQSKRKGQSLAGMCLDASRLGLSLCQSSDARRDKRWYPQKCEADFPKRGVFGGNRR